VIYNTYGPGIYLYESSYSNVYNNTIYNNSTGSDTGHGRGSIRATGRVEYTTNAIIKNNNCYSTSSRDYAIFVDANYVSNGIIVANNNFYRASGNWYFWNNGEGGNLATFNALPRVSGNVNSDPLFVSTSTSDFRLQSNSPCINVGTNVGLTSDFAGIGVPQGGVPEIGAYEYTGAVNPPANLKIIK
jgi:hypothetical protein